MQEKSQNISLEIPSSVLKRLGADPANKILELVEKYIDENAPLQIREKKHLYELKDRNF